MKSPYGYDSLQIAAGMMRSSRIINHKEGAMVQYPPENLYQPADLQGQIPDMISILPFNSMFKFC